MPLLLARLPSRGGRVTSSPRCPAIPSRSGRAFGMSGTCWSSPEPVTRPPFGHAHPCITLRPGGCALNWPIEAPPGHFHPFRVVSDPGPIRSLLGALTGFLGPYPLSCPRIGGHCPPLEGRVSPYRRTCPPLGGRLSPSLSPKIGHIVIYRKCPTLPTCPGWALYGLYDKPNKPYTADPINPIRLER